MVCKKGGKATLRYLLVALFVMTGVLAYSPAPLAAKAASPYVIVVDPGHMYNKGLADSGAVAPDGTKESALNKRLAAKIAVKLKEKGYKVYTTLRVNNDIPNLIGDKAPNITLSMRAAAANAVNADLYIAVHHNSAGPSYNPACGTVILYDEGQGPTATYSRALANHVYNSVAALGYTPGNRYAKVYSQATTVLRENNAPAITFEAGFLTHPDELALLKNPTRQGRMAQKVAEGIEGYLERFGGRDAKPPSAAKRINTSRTPSGKPKFTVAAYGVKDNAGIAGVSMDVSLKGKKHLGVKSVKAKYRSGKWVAAVDIKKLFGDRGGVYNVAVFATDKNGNTGKVGTAKIEYRKDSKPPAPEYIKTSATPSGKSRFSVAAYGVSDVSGVKKVQYSVYRKGKKHLGTKIVTARHKGNGKWVATVDIAKLFGGKSGIYTVDLITTDKKGNTGKAGSVRVEYQKGMRVPAAV